MVPGKTPTKVQTKAPTRTYKPKVSTPTNTYKAKEITPTRSYTQRDEDPRKILRSEGERLISEFLAEEKIHFVHEYPVALMDEQNQVRLWYPDFYLPNLSIVIEYLGMKGKPEYEKAVRRKTKLFRHLRIDFILITPKRLTRPDWKHYIIGKILEIMDSKDSEYARMKQLAKKYKHTPRSHVIGDDWGLD